MPGPWPPGREGAAFLWTLCDMLRAERHRFDLALRPPLLARARARGHDHARRDRRAHDPAQVRAERGGAALSHPGGGGQGDGHRRLAVARAPLPGGRSGRGAAARVRRLRRAVHGARPAHRRGDPRAAPALDPGRGDLPGRLLQARPRVSIFPKPWQTPPPIWIGGKSEAAHAAHRAARRRLDPVLHHARGVARRRPEGAGARGGGGAAGARGSLRHPDQLRRSRTREATALALAQPYIPRGRVDEATMRACTAFGPVGRAARRSRGIREGGRLQVHPAPPLPARSHARPARARRRAGLPGVTTAARASRPVAARPRRILQPCVDSIR